jgi:hypothetical protein
MGSKRGQKTEREKQEAKESGAAYIHGHVR